MSTKTPPEARRIVNKVLTIALILIALCFILNICITIAGVTGFFVYKHYKQTKQTQTTPSTHTSQQPSSKEKEKHITKKTTVPHRVKVTVMLEFEPNTGSDPQTLKEVLNDRLSFLKEKRKISDFSISAEGDKRLKVDIELRKGKKTDDIILETIALISVSGHAVQKFFLKGQKPLYLEPLSDIISADTLLEGRTKKLVIKYYKDTKDMMSRYIRGFTHISIDDMVVTADLYVMEASEKMQIQDSAPYTFLTDPDFIAALINSDVLPCPVKVLDIKVK